MTLTSNQRIGLVAFTVLALDQFTKKLVLNYLGYSEEKVIVEGFFKFVHWHNTGAAWSLFRDHNATLAIVSLVALLGLFLFRHHFSAHRVLGQWALGLMFGGIMGNVVDRLHPQRQHVIDFIYFYVNQRGGGEKGFPAFNIADSAICIGVALLFVLSWQSEPATAHNEPAPTPSAPFKSES
ncbi:MAG: signal peptidase II [Verrucomicrobiota bacterium]|jgi:signal peptidase II